MTGRSWELEASQINGQTHIKYWFDGCETLLLRLVPGQPSHGARPQTILRQQFKQVKDVGPRLQRGAPQRVLTSALFQVKLHKVTLSEPNALLLDSCQFKWRSGDW